jgi:hypothetical protein
MGTTTNKLMANDLEKGYNCRNGLIVKLLLVSTKQNPIAGLIEIIDPHNRVNTTRRIMTSRFENGVKIARILCEDFDL